MKFFALYESECPELRDIVSPEFYQFCIDNIATATISDKQADFFYSSLKSVFDDHGFPFPHPFGSELIYGFESFKFKDERNVIILRTDSNEVILVVQKYYYIDQIFFIDRKLLIKLGHIYLEKNQFIADLHKAYLQYENGKTKLDYSYALDVSSSRPWHSLYSMLGSLNVVYTKFVDNYPSIPIYYGSDIVFLDYAHYFERIETVIKRPDLCVRIEKQCYAWPPYEVDQILLKKARDTELNLEVAFILEKQVKKKSHNKPIIWIGLAVEKRRHISFLDAMKKFITMMITVSPDVLFIFDGLTSPIDLETQAVTESFAEDKVVLDKLLEMILPQNINYIHGSGLSVKQKLRLADLCDFFISDSGTASIYPDRFSRKVGVTFKPNSWPAGEHQHFNSVAIDQTRIYDIYSGKEPVKSDFYIEPNYLASFCFYQFLKTKYA